MKLRNTIILIFIAAILLACAISSFIGIPVKSGEYNPLKSVTLGGDLGGESLIYLSVEEGADISGSENEIISIFRKRLKAFGVDDGSIEGLGEGKYLVRVPMNKTSDNRDADQIAQALSTVADINITDKANNELVFLMRKHIKEVDIMESSLGKFGIYLLLTDEGKKILAEESERISTTPTAEEKYIHVFFDTNQISELTVRQVIDNGILGFNTSYSKQQAEYFKALVNTGKLPAKININAVEKVEAVSANGMDDYLLILGVLGALFALYMIFVHRAAGFVTVISFAAYMGILITVFALTRLKLTGMTMTGTLAAVIYYMASSIVFLEKIKEEYQSRKYMDLALKNGYKGFLKIASNIGFILVLILVVFISSSNAVLENTGFAFGIGFVIAYIFQTVINWLLYKLLTGISDNPKLWFSLKEEKGGAEA